VLRTSVYRTHGQFDFGFVGDYVRWYRVKSTDRDHGRVERIHLARNNRLQCQTVRAAINRDHRQMWCGPHAALAVESDSRRLKRERRSNDHPV